MKNECFEYNTLHSKSISTEIDLVIFTFNSAKIEDGVYQSLNEKYPNAEILIFSTAGHFHADKVIDDTSLVTTFNFDSSAVEGFSFESDDNKSEYDIGVDLAKNIDPNSKALFLVCDGTLVNGSELIRGINDNKSDTLQVFGGLAGDGQRYGSTFVGLNESPKTGRIVGISFKGDKLSFNTGHDRGWSSLGLEFKITKSNKHELIEINNQNAYETLYEYMGEHIDSAFTNENLYYPFYLIEGDENDGVIRTPISVNHTDRTLIYGGNMPEGATVKLMKTGTMQLLDSIKDLSSGLSDSERNDSFVFVISCIGRRIILNDMANEEFIELNSVFNNSTKYLGFYSYGEFSKTGFGKSCKMHNQTLVLGVLTEA